MSLESLQLGALGLTAWQIAFCLLVVFVAGYMRGFTGFGFAMAAVPLLALVIAPARAVPFVVMLQLMAGIWDWRESRRRAHWKSLPWLMAGALAGTPIGTVALSMLSADGARLVIAFCVGLAVFLLARGLRLERPPRAATMIATGLLAGILNGVAAMPGPPVIVLYLAGPFAIEIGRASLLIFFSFNNAVGAASAGIAGLLPGSTIVLAAIAFPLLLLAQWLGRRAFVGTTENRYRRIALAFLAVLAALTAIRSAAALL